MNPPPVDLNKLKNILGASKAIMNKVESGNFETGNIDARALTEDGVRELESSGVKRAPTQSSSNYTEDMVKNSNLPDAIKKVMIERPIPHLTSPSHTFSLDDVSDLIDDKPMGLPKIQTSRKTQGVIRESVNTNSDYMTISKSELNEMVNNIVNERLLEFFAKNNNRMVAENAVKKTIDMLIKEGRLSAKKKTL